MPPTPTPGVDSIDGPSSLEKSFGKNKGKGRQSPWRCQVIICAPPPALDSAQSSKGGKGDKHKSATEPEHLIRANSLAGYWELNRRFLRNFASANIQVNGTTTSPRLANTTTVDDGTGSAAPLISPSAQISPDSLIGESTRVGERASIKKCVVGRHCHIGRGAKLTGCVLWDFVTVEEKLAFLVLFRGQADTRAHSVHG